MENQANTSVTDTGDWCAYRIPCGYCSYMCRPCIKGEGVLTIKWGELPGLTVEQTIGTSVQTQAAPKEE